MLAEKLLPILKERFPDRSLVVGKPPDPCATFPGQHPGIRRVAIYDDGDELTVAIDDLTHGHFSSLDSLEPQREADQSTVDSVVQFLDDLFADRIAVWGQPGVGGGWFHLDPALELGELKQSAVLWSGPLGR